VFVSDVTNDAKEPLSPQWITRFKTGMNRNLKENCLPWSSLGGRGSSCRASFLNTSFLLMFVSLETLLLSGAYVIYLVSRHLGYSPSSPSFESDLTSELPLAVIAGVLF
jgi:hypothetical protein